MYSLTILFGTILGMILLILIMAATVWFPKIGKPDERYTCPFWTMLRGGFFAGFTYYAILILDSAFKTIFIGFFGYGNFSYFLAGIIMITILGIIILVGTVFVAPTWETLLTFIGIFGYTMYFLQFYLPSPEVFTEDEVLFDPLPVVIGMQFGIVLLGRLVRIIRNQPVKVDQIATSESNGNRIPKKKHRLHAEPIWDISVKFKKIINVKVYLILWALFCTEVIFQFEGYGLLSWLF